MAEIELAASTLRLEGVVDGFEAGKLHGWAWCPSDPRQPVRIEVTQGGRLIGSTLAEGYRADLQQAGKRAGYCAYQLPLTELAPGDLQIYACSETAAQRLELIGSPLRIDQAMNTRGPLEAAAHADIFPMPLDASVGLCGFVDQFGPSRLRGWGYRLDGHPMELEVVSAGHVVLRLTPDRWRADIAELRQGDGCCGFDVALPQALCDGELHELELRLAGAGPATGRMLRVRLGTPAQPQAWRGPSPLQRERAAEPGLDLSLIVNFYNMRREAERTLTSLGRAYQQMGEHFSYEVLCIDNGSSPPLDPAWVASFGPQFRLIRPDSLQPSPCRAINQAALAARGRYLGIMIDGAHVLSPGVFNEAAAAWREDPQAVVAVRHWFVGGDQRWLASVGYTREQEDRLFERIRWPANGYELFRISAPIGENPEPWFDGLSESNCLLLPTALYDAAGGMDESFAEPGGGFANLDLWRRVADAAEGALVALLGEASFHQYHDGTTTNVDDTEKDRRVRAYASAYAQRRGTEFTGVPPGALRFRGSMRSEFATGVRQRPLLPLQLGVTERIRPAQLPLHFDEGAQTYLQSVYAESQLHGLTCWQGEPVGIAPADLLNLQEIIRQLRPECIVLAGASPGLRRYLLDLLHLGGLDPDGGQPIRLLDVGHATHALPPPHRLIAGDPHAAETIEAVAHALIASEHVLVLYAGALASETQLPQALAGYAALVSHRSYLICLDSLFGRPWLGYAQRSSRQAIRDFVAQHPDFVIDHSWNRQLITTSPLGYLRKIGTTATAHYDPTLDLLPAQA
jgi:cephalosporin hydroxylase